MIYPWHLYLMGAIYFGAGVMHFVKPKTYMRIIPKYLSNHKELVYASGALEIILGIAVCLPLTKDYAIGCIIAMLTAFLLVHIYMLTPQAKIKIPKWILIIRLILQFALMYWAYYYLPL